jgi:myosin heavy subunit
MINNLDACHLIYNSGVKQVCALLEVIDDVLIKSITHRTLNMRGEAVTSPMNMRMSRDVKDALVKEGILFSRIFIVEKNSHRQLKISE